MVKMIKFVCIAGILALLVLFVLFTGAGRSSAKKDFDDNTSKYQTNKVSKKDHKKIELNTQINEDVFDISIPW